jgi:hypothetical protein
MLNQYTSGSVTKINVRQRLFEEKNTLVRTSMSYKMKTRWSRTNSWRMMVVTLLPLIYTIGVAGFFSGASLFLLFILLAFYVRLDYRFIIGGIQNNRFVLHKGLLFFRNRRTVDIPVSQLISVRISETMTGGDECVMVYYDFKEHAFYEESIPFDESFRQFFLKDVLNNRIAIFKK